MVFFRAPRTSSSSTLALVLLTVLLIAACGGGGESADAVPMPTETANPSPVPTLTSTPSPTATPSPTSSSAPAPGSTPVPTSTSIPTAASSPTLRTTATLTPTPIVTPTAGPSLTPTPTPIPITDGLSRYPGDDSGTARDANGFLLFSYPGGSGGVFVGHCEDAECFTGTRVEIDSNVTSPSNGGGRTQIGIGVDGLPIVVYRRGYSELRIANCEVLSCSAASLGTVTTVPSSFGSLEMAIGADGSPVVMLNSARFGRGEPGNAVIVICSDPVCTSPTMRTVYDDVLQVSDVALGIGSDGNPFAAFESDSRNLNVVHCTDVSCSQFTQRAISGGNMGFGGAIQLTRGSDDLTFDIVYMGSNGETKKVRCNDLSCSSVTALAQ
jgi:hypothetical protein